MPISSKLGAVAVPHTGKSKDVAVLTDAQIARVIAGLPEIKRASSFMRRNSQAQAKLMTLNMLARSPYRMLRQCAAQIESKRKALRDTYFQVQKDRESARQKRDAGNPMSLIEADELECRIEDTELLIQSAIKDIAVYQTAYNDIKKKHGIADNWTEEDFEASEVEHHVKMAFFNAYRDVMVHGSLGNGTMEYLDQFGIHPSAAFQLVKDYVGQVERVLKDKMMPTSEHLDTFLDQMAAQFAEAYKAKLHKMGINTLVDTWFLNKEKTG